MSTKPEEFDDEYFFVKIRGKIRTLLNAPIVIFDPADEPDQISTIISAE